VPFWASKARQFLAHLLARVTTEERRALAAWTTPAELALFDGMHVADRRHGLDVVAYLRRAGVSDRDVLAAGLLHDCGKGDTGWPPRVAWSLGEKFGPWVHATASRIPGWGGAMTRLRDHAELSAAAVEAIGLPPFAVALVREQDAPSDPQFGRLFHAADEAC
jgi:HD domain